MTDTSKKMAAALAAVNAYLQEEQLLLHSEKPALLTQSEPQIVNVWALSGRQDMMSMRQLIQMKAFSRF